MAKLTPQNFPTLILIYAERRVVELQERDRASDWLYQVSGRSPTRGNLIWKARIITSGQYLNHSKKGGRNRSACSGRLSLHARISISLFPLLPPPPLVFTSLERRPLLLLQWAEVVPLWRVRGHSEIPPLAREGIERWKCSFFFMGFYVVWFSLCWKCHKITVSSVNLINLMI